MPRRAQKQRRGIFASTVRLFQRLARCLDPDGYLELTIANSESQDRWLRVGHRIRMGAMNSVTPKILIRHLAGSKKGQTETIEAISLITFGRDVDSTIQFDPDKDDTVSRRHATIECTSDFRRFRLTDVGSTHKTFVNGRPLTAPVDIEPGDEVMLGRATKFVFDLDPRPADFVRRTTMISAIDPAPKPTSISTAISDAPRAGTVGNPTLRTGRPMTAPTRSSRVQSPVIWAVAAALVLAIGGGAGYLAFKPKAKAVVLAPAEKQVLTTQDIAKAYSGSTVYVQLSWRLFDRPSGKPIYHKMLRLSRDAKVPLYVVTKKHGVVPWFTTDDDDSINEPIGQAGSGSGFIVSDTGFVLTNKHVAAGWEVSYSKLPSQGYLVLENETMGQVVAGLSKERVFSPGASPAAEQLYSWIPGDGGLLFERNAAAIIDDRPHAFDGREDILRVQFPNSRQTVDARLVRTSKEADVALVKIESPTALQTLKIAADDNVNLGQKVVVIGYPGISQKVINKSVLTTEAGITREVIESIPQPTVTDGVIANLGLSGQPVTQGETVGTVGDAYQLSVTATGSGNSGGPVLNEFGEVVGLFTYSLSRGGERVTFAVPVKYGRKLMREP